MGRAHKRIEGDNSRSWQPNKDEQCVWKSLERLSILLGLIVSLITIGSAATGVDAAKNADSVNNTVFQQTEGDGYVIQTENGPIIITDRGGISEPAQTDHEMENEGQALLAMLDGRVLADQLAGSTDLIRKKCYSQAVQLLSEMLQQEIDDNKMMAAIYYNRGIAHCYLGDFEVAREDFYKSLANLEFADAYYSLGAASAALARNYEESENTIGDPLKEYTRAIENYSLAINLEEKNTTYFLARAAAYEAIGETDDAIKDYQMVLSLDSENKTACTALGRII